MNQNMVIWRYDVLMASILEGFCRALRLGYLRAAGLYLDCFCSLARCAVVIYSDCSPDTAVSRCRRVADATVAMRQAYWYHRSERAI